MSSPPHSWIRTSGDPLADRRFGYAEALFADRDLAASADLFRQVIEIAPDWPPAHFGLGKALLEAGDAKAARQSLDDCLRLDPEDRQGARALLARLDGLADPGTMSPAFIAQLFDDYAPRFDSHLVEALGYRAPDLLIEALDGASGGRHYRLGHDLGCGTGLMGLALKRRCAVLHGVDLSAGMLERARATGLYASLHCGELVSYVDALPAASADLILAADVFCYVPDLARVFAGASRVLETGGVFGFTVQVHPGNGVIVGHDQRVHHAPDYVRDTLESAGFAQRIVRDASSRLDRGIDVPGAVFLAEKR